jgi:hypothetical protein
MKYSMMNIVSRSITLILLEHHMISFFKKKIRLLNLGMNRSYLYVPSNKVNLTRLTSDGAQQGLEGA